MVREKKEVLPAPPFIPVISRAHRRCVFKERVSLEELPSAISSLTHLTDMANLFSLQVWAGFGERSRDGNKFVVAERPVKQVRRNFCTETEDDIVEERKARRENAANGFFDENENNNSSSNMLDALFVDG